MITNADDRANVLKFILPVSTRRFLFINQFFKDGMNLMQTTVIIRSTVIKTIIKINLLVFKKEIFSVPYIIKDGTAITPVAITSNSVSRNMPFKTTLVPMPISLLIRPLPTK